MCRFGRGAPGVVREEGANLAARSAESAPAISGLTDVANRPPSHPSSVFLTCGVNNCRFLRILCSFLLDPTVLCCIQNSFNKTGSSLACLFSLCLILAFFQIILYSGDKIYDDYYQDLKGRVHFTSNDLKSGDASINVTNLQLSDIGTYQCKVKKAPGVGNKKIQLTVLGKLFVSVLIINRVRDHSTIGAAFM